MKAEIEATKREFRERWALQWKTDYCRAAQYFYTDSRGCKQLDIKRAPQPPWATYKDPEFIGIQWGSGFAIITAEAFAKLPASKLKLLQPGRW